MNKFWETLKPLIPAIELAGNVALMMTGMGAAVVPLLTALENAVNPAIQAIGTSQSVAGSVTLIYGAIIGVLETLKLTPNLPAATIAQIEGYIVAAHEGLGGYFKAQSGFDPANPILINDGSGGFATGSLPLRNGPPVGRGSHHSDSG